MKKVISLFMAVAMVLSFSAITAMADEEKFATIEALQFAEEKEPVIDGSVSLTEWGTPTLENVSYPENTQTDMKAEGDMEFSMWTRYNFEGFYLAITTPDEEHWNSNVVADHNSIWNGDCLQVRLDAYGCTVDQGKVPTADRNGNWNSAYNEFAFALGNDGNTYSYSWHGVVDHEDLAGGNGRYVVAYDKAKQLTTYELFIPWEVILQTPPHVSMSVGFSISVNDGSEADGGGYKNWLEWGSGVMNGRDDNIFGSNRLTFVETRATGGNALVDPNPDDVLADLIEVTEDAFLIPFDGYTFTTSQGVTPTINDDGSLHLAITGDDPQFTLAVDSKYKINAADYRYVALYLKTNDYGYGELFFSTSQSTSISQDCSILTEYQEVEGGQVVVADFQYFEGYEWQGDILKFRYDPVESPADTLTSEMTIYGIGVFKNFEDAANFNIEGVTVELDPNAKVPTSSESETQAPGADDPADETEAPAGTDAATGASTDASTSADTSATGDKADNNSPTGLIIAIIVAVVAVVAVVVVVILKKKKA